MKGISPFIAIVLMIAIVMGIGGIVSIWLTGSTRTTTAIVESTTEKLQPE